MALKLTTKKLVKAAEKGWLITPRLTPFLSADQQNCARIPDTIEWGAFVVELLAHIPDYTRSGSFHSSELGGCHRAQVLGYLGFPGKDKHHSPETINIFNDGTWRHARWQLTLMKAGIITAAEVPVEVPNYRFSGSIDGANAEEHWGLELKGTSQFDQVKNFGALKHHLRQVQGYMFGRPDLEKFVILYEDKATNQWHEEIVPRDSYEQRQIKQTLEALNAAVESKKLPPVLEECEFGQGAYKQCSHAYACKQIDWSSANEGRKCGSSEEVIVKLGIKRRNTHRSGSHSEGTAAKNVPDWRRAARSERVAGRTPRVRRRLDGSERQPG